MSTTEYFKEDLYPTDMDNGRADKTATALNVEIFRSSYFGGVDQIYLRLNDNTETTYHLTKEQATELADALSSVVGYIGYDNS